MTFTDETRDADLSGPDPVKPDLVEPVLHGPPDDVHPVRVRRILQQSGEETTLQDVDVQAQRGCGRHGRHPGPGEYRAGGLGWWGSGGGRGLGSGWSCDDIDVKGNEEIIRVDGALDRVPCLASHRLVESLPL